MQEIITGLGFPSPNQLSHTGTGINQCDTRCEHGLKLANLFVTGYKVMFLLVSVILLTGGGLPQCMLGRKHPPGRKQCMLGRKHPPVFYTNFGKEAVHAGKEAHPPNWFRRKQCMLGRKHPHLIFAYGQ